MRCSLRFLVLRVLDSLHEVFIIHVFYYYLVLNYARPIALSENIWSVNLSKATPPYQSVTQVPSGV